MYVCMYVYMHVCMYFAILKNVWNTNENYGRVRDYIINYFAKREAESKKHLQIQDGRDDLKKIQNGSYLQ